MNKLTIKSQQILSVVSNLEKKHKIITYVSLLFLTVSTYFLRSENQNVKIEYATIKERNLNLQKNMVIYNRSYEDFPLPVWQKVKRGDKFIIQYINPTYIQWFGQNFNYDRYNVIGKTNFEVFPKKIAQLFYEHDVAVAITGDVISDIENQTDIDGKNIKISVLKWRSIRNEKDTLVYGMVRVVLNPKEINIKSDFELGKFFPKIKLKK